MQALDIPGRRWDLSALAGSGDGTAMALGAQMPQKTGPPHLIRYAYDIDMSGEKWVKFNRKRLYAERASRMTRAAVAAVARVFWDAHTDHRSSLSALYKTTSLSPIKFFRSAPPFYFLL